jgi:hypothetical protein
MLLIILADDNPILAELKAKVTVRQLLLHVGGTAYESFNPITLKYFNKLNLPKLLTKTKEAIYSCPLVQEPGMNFFFFPPSCFPLLSLIFYS